MKRIACMLVSSALMCIACNQPKKETQTQAQTQTEETPDLMKAQVSFADTLHDFGHVPVANPRRQYDFTFTNTGRVPAVILNATPSCHCTFVEFSKEAVMPGKQGTVTVIFDGNEQPAGHFNKSVRVRFNSEHLHNLRIKGVMEGE